MKKTSLNLQRKKVKRLIERFKKLDRSSLLLALCAVMGVVVVSVAGVLVVRANLTAKTNNKINPFAPMTYTNTEIKEDHDTWSDIEQDSSYDVSVAKKAKVENNDGTDKKPVFIRVAVTYSVYDSAGVNITSEHPCTLSFDEGSGWVKKNDDGYYYYNAIVVPGGLTNELFGSDVKVSFNDGDALPSGARVEIDVVADTVQAVATDSSKWKASDYTADEVSKVWTHVPSFTVPNDKKDTREPINITWS